MQTPPLARVRVPAEFIGRARAFRARLEAADAIAIAVIRKTSRAVNARVARHPVPRADMLASVARAWRIEMPGFGRIDQQATVERKALRIVETRFCPQHFRNAAWEADAREPGISAVRIEFGIAPFTKLSLSIASLASCSLHALGRRYERGFDTSEAAILMDLRSLVEARAVLGDAPDGSPFNLDVAGGRWHGTVLDIEAAVDGTLHHVLAARTFVER